MTILMSWSHLAVLCGVTGLVLAIAHLFRPDSRIWNRIQDRAARGSITPPLDQSIADKRATANACDDQIISTWLPNQQRTARLRRSLQQAGFDPTTAVATFVCVQLALVCVFGILVAWLCHTNPAVGIDWRLAACAGGALGYLMPAAWLHRRKRHRLQTLNRSLPDLLDLMVSCLDAGLSLEAVIQRIAEEKDLAHNALTEEIQRVQREIELGATPDRALQSCAERTDSEEIRALSVVCLQARKYGARISSTLRAHADALREHREQEAEEAAQKAAVKILAPTLLCLFPVIFIVLAAPAAFQIHDNLSGKSESTSSEKSE